MKCYCVFLELFHVSYNEPLSFPVVICLCHTQREMFSHILQHRGKSNSSDGIVLENWRNSHDFVMLSVSPDQVLHKKV